MHFGRLADARRLIVRWQSLAIVDQQQQHTSQLSAFDEHAVHTVNAPATGLIVRADLADLDLQTGSELDTRRVRREKNEKQPPNGEQFLSSALNCETVCPLQTFVQNYRSETSPNRSNESAVEELAQFLFTVRILDRRWIFKFAIANERKQQKKI